MRGTLPIVLLAIFGSVQSAATAQETSGRWQVREVISPLTGAKTYSASVASNETLLNQIEQPDHAALVLRCREGVMAVYVAWPQVLSHDSETFVLSLPETMVFTRN